MRALTDLFRRMTGYDFIRGLVYMIMAITVIAFWPGAPVRGPLMER